MTTSSNPYALTYYHKNAAAISQKRKKSYQDKKDGTYIKHNRVVNYTDGTITRRQAAIYMGITQHKLTNIVSRTTRFNVKEHLSSAGRVEYKVKELDIWKANNLDLFEDGMFKQEKHEGAKVSNNVMLVVNWMQKAKHIQKYCNTQRVAINSNQFWSRWA